MVDVDSSTRFGSGSTLVVGVTVPLSPALARNCAAETDVRGENYAGLLAGKLVRCLDWVQLN